MCCRPTSCGCAALGADVIQTRGSGYRIDVGRDELDLLRFQELAAQGDSAAARSDDETAAARFGEAVALWRGPALSNVESDVLRREDVAVLNEQRLAAWQRWADAQLRLGATPVAELTRMTGEYPLHEPFWAQLMQALHRAGRTAEALTAFRHAGDVLAEQLGVDPGPALQRTYQAVLTGESEPPMREVPRQLAAAVDGFTGRAGELAQLAELPDAVSDTSSAIAVIEGPPAWARPPSRCASLMTSRAGSPAGSCSSTCTARRAARRNRSAGRRVLVLPGSSGLGPPSGAARGAAAGKARHGQCFAGSQLVTRGPVPGGRVRAARLVVRL